MKGIKLWLVLFCFLGCVQNIYSAGFKFKKPMYFVTVSDKEHYACLCNLIESIISFHKKKLGVIAVFDLGLTPEQRAQLEGEKYVRVYDLEVVNPDMTKKYVVRPNGRLARGWYSWKPVAIKQALEMFPYILYIDAGMQLAGPVDAIFNCIMQQGYFFFDCGHSIGWMTPQKIVKKFDLNSEAKRWILDAFGISAGIQGLSKKMYDTYVMPMYRLAHDIDNFVDDGTTPDGFGTARHDQALFSIVARLLALQVHKNAGDGPRFFKYKRKKIKFCVDNYFKFKEYEVRIRLDAT